VSKGRRVSNMASVGRMGRWDGIPLVDTSCYPGCPAPRVCNHTNRCKILLVRQAAKLKSADEIAVS
jgi:hypothetical protein